MNHHAAAILGATLAAAAGLALGLLIHDWPAIAGRLTTRRFR